MKVLGQEGRIVAYPLGKEVRLFPGGMPKKHLRWISVLGDGPAAGIMDQLKDRPGQRLMELSSSLGLSRKVIRRHLALLDEEGYVTQEGETRPRYHLRGEETPVRMPLLHAP